MFFIVSLTLGIPKLIIAYLSLDILNISGGKTLISRTGQFLIHETKVPFKCYIYLLVKKLLGKQFGSVSEGKIKFPRTYTGKEMKLIWS